MIEKALKKLIEPIMQMWVKKFDEELMVTLKEINKSLKELIKYYKETEHANSQKR